MANANFIELEACIKDCIGYCKTHQSHEFVTYYEHLLGGASRKFDEAIEVSDAFYLKWQEAVRAERLAWKKVAAIVRSTQKMLKRVSAQDFPARPIWHWDRDEVREFSESMQTYLKNAPDIEFAADQADILKRATEKAEQEASKERETFDAYSRNAQRRAGALGTLNAVLGDFRVSMRRTLGKKSEEYHSIRWPMTLAPDEPVL